MLDFREHKELIRKLVQEENKEDPNWFWTVRSISNSKIMVKWSYLDYLEAKYPLNHFVIEAKAEKVGDDPEDCIIWRTPEGKMISFTDVGASRFCDFHKAEPAIAHAIRSLAAYAHNVY